MKQYVVKWEIDVTATCPREAAKEAMMIMQDKDSEALVFTVNSTDKHNKKSSDTYVDLDEEPSDEELNDKQWYHYSGVDKVTEIDMLEEALSRR